MKAMILAAGLGKRMRPLTDHVPKPLLRANGRYLIEYHLERIAKAGMKDVVINTHWLGEMIPEALGDGEQWGLSLSYSPETELLETAGGIIEALPLLTDGLSAFLVVNGDVFTDLDLTAWLESVPILDEQTQAFLALVPNPEHNPDGDFSIDPDTSELYLKDERPGPTATYSGIAVFHPDFFRGFEKGKRALGPILKDKIQQGVVAGVLTQDYWLDVGTPERLKDLEAHLV